VTIRLRTVPQLDVAGAVNVLRGVSLFADLPQPELDDLARVMQPIECAAGESLWRQGQAADGLHVVLDGTVAVSLRQPGGGEVRVTTLGRGEVLGDVPLLDGGLRSASASAERAARLLFLSRVEFDALSLRRPAAALAIRRRICALVAARLRTAYGELADSLNEPPAPAAGSTAPAGDELRAGAPPIDYLRRLAFFQGFGEQDLADVLGRSQVAFVGPSRKLVAEGEPTRACYITLNGAVEERIERGDQRIAVGLAGPGRAFGYAGLIDGLPSALTAVTRERSLLLVVPAENFEHYFNGTTSVSRAFFAGIQCDLMMALRRKDVGFVRSVRQELPSAL
jgi:CRP-like cAMP-binding protein